MSEKPLILISNDDGYSAKGINELMAVAREFADIVVMAPEGNASAKSHSLTTSMPLRAKKIREEAASGNLHSLAIYACNGTPVDCVKLATEHFCPRRPTLVLSGINHGSNASINILYSGTMGAALEAVTNGYPAIGFSLLDHNSDADFSACLPFIRQIIEDALTVGLPEDIALNVNFPYAKQAPYKGLKVCRASRACWSDSFEQREDPYHQPYWWLTGKFICNDTTPDTDQWALENGYVSVVPVKPDYTAFEAITNMKRLEK